MQNLIKLSEQLVVVVVHSFSDMEEGVHTGHVANLRPQESQVGVDLLRCCRVDVCVSRVLVDVESSPTLVVCRVVPSVPENDAELVTELKLLLLVRHCRGLVAHVAPTVAPTVGPTAFRPRRIKPTWLSTQGAGAAPTREVVVDQLRQVGPAGEQNLEERHSRLRLREIMKAEDGLAVQAADVHKARGERVALAGLARLLGSLETWLGTGGVIVCLAGKTSECVYACIYNNNIITCNNNNN